MPPLLRRLRAAPPRLTAAFWLFGLVNNIFYVLILTAALDLVGPSIPKATVLLASIIPGLATKLVAPYIIHAVPDGWRIALFAALSTCGMLAVALSPDNADAASLAGKVAGIVLANISSGAGEVSFLGWTAYYGPFSLAAWGSGTGGAGLIGAGAYALATTTLGFGVRGTLMCSALLPGVMLGSYFVLLPLGPLRAARRKELDGRRSEREAEDDDEEQPTHSESAGLLTQHPPVRAISPAYASSSGSKTHTRPPGGNTLTTSFRANLTRSRALLTPYMLPLFLVYLAEYTLNQGVSPVLLFPLSSPSTPFTEFRAFYPTYTVLYQTGVLLSRSSLPFFRVRKLYTPALLQVLNLVLLTTHALWPFLPSVWFVFGMIFWEGLLGGLVYVSTFAAIREDVAEEGGEREFGLGAATIADSSGIFVAGLLGAVLEPALCGWQVQRGRDWCQRL